MAHDAAAGTSRNRSGGRVVHGAMQGRARSFVIGLFAMAASGVGIGLAEQAPSPPPQVCPQDETGGPRAPRGAPSPADNPSDRLADSQGVICPPAGIDPGIRVKPPGDEGAIKIVPAPGTPGGNPDVQPK